jgi:hypothetical protein
MRILFALLALPLLTFSAQAQTTNTESTHKRLTMEQHFEQANTTHDGHLTEEQAQTGYKSIARHFAASTRTEGLCLDDIPAYHKTQHTLHGKSAAAHHHPNG